MSDLTELLAAMGVLVPIVLGLTEAVKRAIPRNVDRWAPGISIALGVGAAFIFPPNMVPVNEIGAGILSGLAASGLYSGTKTAVTGR